MVLERKKKKKVHIINSQEIILLSFEIYGTYNPTILFLAKGREETITI